MVTLQGRHYHSYFPDGNIEGLERLSGSCKITQSESGKSDLTPGFPDCEPSPFNCSAHSAFAKHSWPDYLIRFSELNRVMDDMVGRKTRAAEWRMDDRRDWPLGR